MSATNSNCWKPANKLPASGGRSAPPCSVADVTMPQIVHDQIVNAAERRGIPQWVDASKWLPQGPHEVLATDGESWFVACLQGAEWWLHELDEPCDSVVTHWMELPELPEG